MCRCDARACDDDVARGVGADDQRGASRRGERTRAGIDAKVVGVHGETVTELSRCLRLQRVRRPARHHSQTDMDGLVPRSRSRRSREAIRLAGATWRHLHRSVGDPCNGCGSCDLGADSHESHECSLTPAWFAGVSTVCHSCFAQMIRVELRSQSDQLTDVSERVAGGDAPALDEWRRLMDSDAASA